MEKSTAFDEEFIDFCNARAVEQNDAYRALVSLAYEIASHEGQAAQALEWAKNYLDGIEKYGLDPDKCRAAATSCTEAHDNVKVAQALRVAFRGQLKLAFGSDLLSDWAGRSANAR